MRVQGRLVPLILGVAASGVAFAALHLWRPPVAHACGCFAPPDPSVPVVQSGERIVFAVEGNQVTAHIQIQYSGDAAEFAWLVPLPAVPEMTLGTDELFAQIISTTQPKYLVTRESEGFCNFDPNPLPPASPGDSQGGGAEDGSPLVLEGSIGPYDYAVLSAEARQPMLDWLAENGFFVPAGTDTAVVPYIRPGAYFLALKLRSGESTGNLQPVALRYQSTLPMIPIVLTGVAADPNMPILVWVVGEHRAIPRNFYHTRINDAAIDWFGFGQNYLDIVKRAVDDAERGQSFVTEYAGSTSVMRDLLDYQGRFGDLDTLASLTDAVTYTQYLYQYGYALPTNQPPFFGPQFPSQMLALLQRDLPVPALLLSEYGLTPDEYYLNLAYWIGDFRAQNPQYFTDLDLEFDPVVLTADIEERIVRPNQEAGRLFRDFPYLTRLFTMLSPEEMTRDPVFSFNPDLPEVSNIHTARFVYECGWGLPSQLPQTSVPGRLITPDGWVLDFPDGESTNPWLSVAMPASAATEILREEGAPEVVDDNSAEIAGSLDEQNGENGGCATAGGHGGAGALLLLGASLLVVRRRRSRG